MIAVISARCLEGTEISAAKHSARSVSSVVRQSGFQNPANFFHLNPESSTLESGVQN